MLRRKIQASILAYRGIDRTRLNCELPMRHLKYVIPVLVVLLVVVAGWLFWEEQRHNLQNSIDDNGLPSQSQRAAALALIPQQGANLYSLPNNQVQNLTNLPRVNSNTIGSMIVELHPIALIRPMILPGVKTNTIAPISTSTASISILNFPPGLTSDYQPSLADVERASSCDINPVDLALRMQPRDQDLIDWLQDQEWELANERPNEAVTLEVGADEHLSYILNNSKFSWFELFEIGNSIYNYTQDAQAAAVFYIEAVKSAHRILITLIPTASQVRPILLAMHKTKDILWEGYDHNYACLQALYLLNNDLVHWAKPGDPVLEFAYQHGKIGMLECMIFMGNTDQAIAVGKKTDVSVMSNDEKTEIAWNIGRALWLTRKYTEAMPYLMTCANDRTSKLCRDAWELWIDSLNKTNQIAKARDVYQQYLVRFKPTDSQINELNSYLTQSRKEDLPFQ